MLLRFNGYIMKNSQMKLQVRAMESIQYLEFDNCNVRDITASISPAKEHKICGTLATCITSYVTLRKLFRNFFFFKY